MTFLSRQTIILIQGVDLHWICVGAAPYFFDRNVKSKENSHGVAVELFVSMISVASEMLMTIPDRITRFVNEFHDI